MATSMDRNTNAEKARVVAELTALVDCGEIDVSVVDERHGEGTVAMAIDRLASVKDRSKTLMEILGSFKALNNSDAELSDGVVAVYSHWVDKDAAAARVDNLLVSQEEADSRGSRRNLLSEVLAKIVARHGEAELMGAHFFGWKDKRAENTGNVIAVVNVREEQWSYWEEFVTESETYFGVSGDVITDTGYSRRFRVEGSLDTLMGLSL